MTTLHFRELGWGDWGFCRELASDPDVRSASFDPHPPTWLQHALWMWDWIVDLGQRNERQGWIIERRALPSGYEALWHVGLTDETPTSGPLGPVGLLRAARLPNGGSEVSIALLKEARGRGIGTKALAGMAPVLQKLFDGPVYARVKMANVASVRAFTEAGFGIPPLKEWERLSHGQHGIYVLRWPKEE